MMLTGTWTWVLGGIYGETCLLLSGHLVQISMVILLHVVALLKMIIM